MFVFGSAIMYLLILEVEGDCCLNGEQILLVNGFKETNSKGKEFLLIQ